MGRKKKYTKEKKKKVIEKKERKKEIERVKKLAKTIPITYTYCSNYMDHCEMTQLAKLFS